MKLIIVLFLCAVITYFTVSYCNSIHITHKIAEVIRGVFAMKASYVLVLATGLLALYTMYDAKKTLP